MSEPTATPHLVRVYVWEWPVRVTHWLIAGSIVLCSATGIYIGAPFLIAAGPAGGHFVMGWAKVLHFYGSIVFTLSVLSRIAWMFVGNKYARWNKFIPVQKRRIRGLLPTLKFYLFIAPRPPLSVGHNPLAGLSYTVIFGMYFVMIGTGLAMHSVSAAVGSPLRVFGLLVPLLGGLQVARWIHHVVMWAFVIFAIHHVYSAILVSDVEANATVDSIFSGYKFVPAEDLASSGSWFQARKPDEYDE